jgi:hypothetical protein
VHTFKRNTTRANVEPAVVAGLFRLTAETVQEGRA